ncbi:hypothetical protein [Ottowia caeni]|uniref:hypothetical protein n=1 Tax=Ottowia caeni TaxID=2870339 RepID=UPI003D7385DB
MVTSPAEVRGSAVAHAGLENLGPLAWVLDETRKSIEGSAKLLKLFAHESEMALGTGAAEIDAGQVRTARQQLHQVSGALEMVGQEIAARVVRGMEDAVQHFVLHPEKCNEAAASSLERAGFALIEYLESQLGEQPRPAVGLFSQYREVLKLAEAERIHPADLWPVSWRWTEPATPSASQVLNYGREVRSQLDQRVLKIMRGEDANAASELGLICLGLAAGETAQQPSVFWRLAAGFLRVWPNRWFRWMPILGAPLRVSCCSTRPWRVATNRSLISCALTCCFLRTSATVCPPTCAGACSYTPGLGSECARDRALWRAYFWLVRSGCPSAGAPPH